MENKNNVRVCIYARVSSQLQDHQRQLVELQEYSDRMEYEVIRTFSEKMSGAKKVAERQGMSVLLAFVETNKIDRF